MTVGLGRRRRFALLVTTLATAIAVAAPAGAAPPQRNDLTFTDTVACGDGITYTVQLQGRETVMEFEDGVRIHQNWHGSVVASTGTTLRVHHASMVVLDFAAGTFTITGLGFGTWVEGSSIRQLDRGRLVLDLASGELIFAAGEWTPDFDPERMTCELIAEAAS